MWEIDGDDGLGADNHVKPA